jgi:peptidoglycan/LPS O-acetylase OafA/YrhL
MPALLSVYFDCARVAAALVVLISHAWPAFFPKHPLPWPGHQAVVIFFVLSGYVIAFVSDTKEKTWKAFSTNRALRILTVTIPALAIALAIDRFSDPTWRNTLPSYVLALFFLNETWSINNPPQTIAPYWSICYEVWYYAIFATAIYSPPRFRIVLTAIAATLAGPKILLLMPSWLLGVFLYRARDKLTFNKTTAVLMIGVTVLMYAVFFWFDAAIHLRELLRSFSPNFVAAITASNQFLGDDLLAVIVTLNFAAILRLAVMEAAPGIVLSKAANRLAGFTFSLYLYHYPLVTLLTHMHVAGFTGLFATVIVSALLGTVTEHRRRDLEAFLLKTHHRKPAIALTTFDDAHDAKLQLPLQ